MNALTYYGILDGSLKKLTHATNILAYLHWMTYIPITRLNNLSYRNAKKLAIKAGYVWGSDWRNYTVMKHLREDRVKGVSLKGVGIL